MAASEDLRIRLIEIRPQQPRGGNGVRFDLLQCTAFVTSLASAPCYKALSYAWGDPTITSPIVVDGVEVEVTINLEAAVRHLAETISEPLVIWIDAICIDQSNNAEKSRHVSRMRDIYAQAEEVIAWLGRSEDPQQARIALEWIKVRGMRANEIGIGSTPELYLTKVLERTEEQSDDGTTEFAFATDLIIELSNDTNSEYSVLVAALQAFLDRPYWTRLWVVQEVKLPTKVTFVCVEGTIELNVLRAALRLFRNFRHWQLAKLGSDPSGSFLDSNVTGKVLETNPSHALHLLKIRGIQRFASVALLRTLREWKATDPRDRVFATLGLSENMTKLGLNPDYSFRCEQVYTALARKLLQRGKFEILESCISFAYRHGAKYLLQSWVPDWTMLPMRQLLQQRGLHKLPNGTQRANSLQPDFCATGHRGQCEIEDAVAWNDPLFLSVIKIGQVSSAGSSSVQGNLGPWLQSVQDLTRLSSCRHHGPAEESMATWRTAAADQDVRTAGDKPRLGNHVVERLQAAFSGVPLCSLQRQHFVNNGLRNYAEVLSELSRNRRPFLLSSGHLGIGPSELLPGDDVVVVLGAGLPYVLRQEGDKHFVFIGSAYVHGCMDGEAAGEDAIVQRIELH